MKKFFYLAIFAVCLSGCAPSGTKESANIRTNVDISELNNPNMNAYSNTNANTAMQGNTWVDTNGSQVTVNKKGGGNVNAAPVAPNVKQAGVSAPDNSEIISGMNNQGQMVETRTFKSSPTLAKVERVYVELNNQIITAYLKNGQKVDLTSIKINNPMQDSAEDIVKAIDAAKASATTKKP